MPEVTRVTDISITQLQIFAVCSDGKTRAVMVQPGKAFKLYHFLKENICGGVIRLTQGTVELPIVPNTIGGVTARNETEPSEEGMQRPFDTIP